MSECRGGIQTPAVAKSATFATRSRMHLPREQMRQRKLTKRAIDSETVRSAEPCQPMFCRRRQRLPCFLANKAVMLPRISGLHFIGGWPRSRVQKGQPSLGLLTVGEAATFTPDEPGARLFANKAVMWPIINWLHFMEFAERRSWVERRLLASGVPTQGGTAARRSGDGVVSLWGKFANKAVMFLRIKWLHFIEGSPRRPTP
jgi:hypothetical protein